MPGFSGQVEATRGGDLDVGGESFVRFTSLGIKSLSASGQDCQQNVL